MQIQGPGPVHSAHSINTPQFDRVRDASPVSPSAMPTDEVEISEMGQLLESTSTMPEIRHERVEQIRRAIAEGTYETADKLNLAVDRLLDELI